MRTTPSPSSRSRESSVGRCDSSTPTTSGSSPMRSTRRTDPCVARSVRQACVSARCSAWDGSASIFSDDESTSPRQWSASAATSPSDHRRQEPQSERCHSPRRLRRAVTSRHSPVDPEGLVFKHPRSPAHRRLALGRRGSQPQARRCDGRAHLGLCRVGSIRPPVPAAGRRTDAATRLSRRRPARWPWWRVILASVDW